MEVKDRKILTGIFVPAQLTSTRREVVHREWVDKIVAGEVWILQMQGERIFGLLPFSSVSQ
jgi:hypothetical protein